ncbi:Mediator of RNA polymerase II transcription subunit 29 [Ataeniobius toweri]|uniref:Mediator of RNA polymerase II transcription subunit 29 n=1 Tax=Ataeniobius toweri TaxID=208326 RepID=A0ABU7ASH4_9TELE|nr:Mediator of RNA polymerase II transcription subunit 29 [Ataeniobius toweri]
MASQQQQAVGPMSQAGLQQTASMQQQQQQQLSQQQDFDPVHRFKMLIPQLKESLQNLMKIAALNLAHNTSIDNGIKSSDTSVQRFDKSLEEFYALCDQVELCLVEAKNCVNMVKRCIAGGGSNTMTAGVSLHHFPEGKRIRAAWIRAGKLTRERWAGPNKHSQL